MYTSSTIMNFILEGKICFTETGWKCKTSLYENYTSPLQWYMQNIPPPLKNRILSRKHLELRASLKITDLHGWLLVFHLRYKYHILTRVSWILHICKNVGRPTRSSVNILRLLPPPSLKIFTLLLVGCPTFTIYHLPCRPRPPGSWYIFAYSSSPWYPHEYMYQY